MRISLGFFIAMIAAGAAAAAPIWIERRFVRAAELLDPAFAVVEPSSDKIVDNAAYASFLKTYLKVGDDGVHRIAYGDVAANDDAALRDYIASLEAIDPATLSRDEQLAFWINLYNAATVRLILDNYPVKSIRKIDGAWSEKAARIVGRDLSLDDIEHGVIRPTARDPRIHYAVNCASIGCPNLAARPYAGATINDMLDAAARAYVNHPRGARTEDGDLTVSKIYGWFREDFGADEAAVLDHIRQYARPELSEALKGRRKINDYEYDWALNDAAASQ